MALHLGGGVAVTTSAELVGTVPPGVCTVVVSNTTPTGGTAGTVYLGTTANVTASGGGQGFPLPSDTTITFYGYPGSTGTPLYAIGGTGTSVAVAVLVSTTQ
jgi:hypothetical protein